MNIRLGGVIELDRTDSGAWVISCQLEYPDAHSGIEALTKFAELLAYADYEP